MLFFMPIKGNLDFCLFIFISFDWKIRNTLYRDYCLFGVFPIMDDLNEFVIVLLALNDGSLLVFLNLKQLHTSWRRAMVMLIGLL